MPFAGSRSTFRSEQTQTDTKLPATLHAIMDHRGRPRHSLPWGMSLAGGGCGNGVVELKGVIGTEHHSGPMAFSPDGTTLALPKTSDGRVELWGLGGREPRVLASSANTKRTAANRIAFSKDGRHLAVQYYKRGRHDGDLQGDKDAAESQWRQPTMSKAWPSLAMGTLSPRSWVIMRPLKIRRKKEDARLLDGTS